MFAGRCTVDPVFCRFSAYSYSKRQPRKRDCLLLCLSTGASAQLFEPAGAIVFIAPDGRDQFHAYRGKALHAIGEIVLAVI